MTTDELIAETLRHDAAATAGPWDAWESARETYVRQRAATDGAVIAYADVTGEPTFSEYALIAAYRTAAPLLARKLQRAMEALEAIRRSRWASGCDHVAAVREAIADIEAMQ